MEQVKIFAMTMRHSFDEQERRVNSWLLETKDKIDVLRVISLGDEGALAIFYRDRGSRIAPDKGS